MYKNMLSVRLVAYTARQSDCSRRHVGSFLYDGKSSTSIHSFPWEIINILIHSTIFGILDVYRWTMECFSELLTSTLTVNILRQSTPTNYLTSRQSPACKDKVRAKDCNCYT